MIYVSDISGEEFEFEEKNKDNIINIIFNHELEYITGGYEYENVDINIYNGLMNGIKEKIEEIINPPVILSPPQKEDENILAAEEEKVEEEIKPKKTRTRRKKKNTDE